MAPGNHRQNYPKKKKKKGPVLKLGYWNVRTMMTGLSACLQEIKDSRKTAVSNDKLKRLNVDIATLQETGLADSGTLKEKDYTFFWQGKRSNEPREHGVGFPMMNSLPRMVEPVRHTKHKRHVLREPCIHHQEHSQQGTSCCSG